MTGQPTHSIDQAVFDELRAAGEAAGEDFLAELVAQFIHDTERLLLELREAVEVDDAGTAGFIAHDINGSSGQVGGLRLAFACDRLARRLAAGHLPGAHSDLEAVESGYLELRGALTELLSDDDHRLPERIGA